MHSLSKWFGAAEASPEDEEEMFKRFTIDQNKKYGEGGYGATFAAQDTKTGQAAAVKVIDTRRMRLEAIRKECSILEGLVHTNVITLLGHGSGRKSSGQAHLYFIFMEVASGGELFDQVIDRGAMSEATGRKFMSQLLAGVHHCHSRGVAHRDLKLENVLLTKDGVVKVIDFGLSHIYAKGGDGEFDRSVLLKEMCGSKSYAAPEVLSGVGYDGFLADVWSLGVCLFAMLSRSTRPPPTTGLRQADGAAGQGPLHDQERIRLVQEELRPPLGPRRAAARRDACRRPAAAHDDAGRTDPPLVARRDRGRNARLLAR